MLCLAGCLAACVTAVSAIAARPASGQRTTRVMTCNVRITGLPEDDTAGRAARIALEEGVRPSAVDVEKVREELRQTGAYLR